MSESTLERPPHDPQLKPNVELLQKVKAHILEEPRRFRMAVWYKHYEPEVLPLNPLYPPCGTAACLAGTAYILSPELQEKVVVRGADRWITTPDTMDLIGDSSFQIADYLGIPESYFYTGSWPYYFQEKWNDVCEDFSGIMKTQELAKVAADFIDWLCGM